MTLPEFVEHHSLTTEAVAKELGVSQPFVSRLLRGERGASLALALKIEDWTQGQVKAASMNAVLAAYAERQSLDDVALSERAEAVAP